MLDKKKSYSTITKIFHWVRVLLLILLFVSIKIYQNNYSYGFFLLHIIAGISLFVLVVVNIVYRLFNNYPQFDKINVLEKNLQLITYYNMYFILILIPILGYISLVYEIDLYLFSIKPIYAYSIVNNFLENTFFITPAKTFSFVSVFLHKWLFYLLLLLISIHLFLVLLWEAISKGKEIKKMF